MPQIRGACHSALAVQAAQSSSDAMPLSKEVRELRGSPSQSLEFSSAEGFKGGKLRMAH